MQRNDAAVRREKLRSALESWDPGRGSRSNGPGMDGEHALFASRHSRGSPDSRLEAADLHSTLEDISHEASSHWHAINSFRAKLSASRGTTGAQSQSLRSKGREGDPPREDADVSSQVLDRLLALLQEKEEKWRAAAHRVSVLESENADLQARLTAAEQSNTRLKTRLHSGVAAFHRTLEQAKGKIKDKDAELTSALTQTLQLEVQLKTRSAEVAQLRQQVALLHRWCSPSSPPLLSDLDAEAGDDSHHSWRDRRGWNEDRETHSGKPRRGRAWRDEHTLSPAAPWDDDLDGPGDEEDEEAEEEWHKAEDEREGRADEDEKEYVDARLHELAALRALRKAIEGRRKGTQRDGRALDRRRRANDAADEEADSHAHVPLSQDAAHEAEPAAAAAVLLQAAASHAQVKTPNVSGGGEDGGADLMACAPSHVRDQPVESRDTEENGAARTSGVRGVSGHEKRVVEGEAGLQTDEEESGRERETGDDGQGLSPTATPSSLPLQEEEDLDGGR